MVKYVCSGTDISSFCAPNMRLHYWVFLADTLWKCYFCQTFAKIIFVAGWRGQQWPWDSQMKNLSKKIAVWNLIIYLYSIFMLRVYFKNLIEIILKTTFGSQWHNSVIVEFQFFKICYHFYSFPVVYRNSLINCFLIF